MPLNNVPKLADVNSAALLDLSVQDAVIVIPITNGQGVLGVDVVGLTGSGATLVCEMRIGNTWRASNMLVSGTNGAFTQSITADAQFRSSAAAKWAARVRVSAPGTGTASVSWSLSTNSSVVQFTAPLPPGNNLLGNVGIAGTATVNVSNPSLPVTGTFWPATQPVSGNVTVSFASGSTLPVTQSGAWNVSISGTLPAFAATPTFNLGTAPTLNVTDNGGSFTVDTGTPGTFTVTAGGTFPVSGTFFQATQPVSATSLPLPSGAATATGVQAVVTALGTPLQAGGNVAVTALPPIPTGANLIGSVADRAAINAVMAQVAVQQTPVRLLVARPTRQEATIVPSTTGIFYLGTSSAMTTTSASIFLQGTGYTHDAQTELWAIAGSGTITFGVADEYN